MAMRNYERPAAIMEAVNNDLRGIFGGRSFMSAMCVALDAKNGQASVVGAGIRHCSSHDSVAEPKRLRRPLRR